MSIEWKYVIDELIDDYYNEFNEYPTKLILGLRVYSVVSSFGMIDTSWKQYNHHEVSLKVLKSPSSHLIKVV